MALRLKIVSSHRNALGDRCVKEFGREGGTIGRSLQSDWVLPDSQRYVSSRHASIDFRSGSYYVVDTSTNGVYVNGADRPVGRGKPQRLFNGDRIRIGEFEMVAEIDDDSSGIPLLDEDHVDPVDLAQRVEAPGPAGEDMLDAFEITGVGIEMQLSDDEIESLIAPSKRGEVLILELEDETDPEGMATTKPHIGRTAARAAAPGAERSAAGARRSPPGPAAKPGVAASTTAPKANAAAAAPISASRPGPVAAKAAVRSAGTSPSQASAAKRAAPAARPAPSAPVHEPPPQAVTRAQATSRAPAPAKQPGASVTSVSAGKTTTQALEPFFRGAGIRSQRMDQQHADAMLLCLGQLMREMIVGITEILHQRAEQKNALRLPNTTIQPRNNNPLKFSAGVEEMLLNLLLRDSTEYLLPVEAVREAFADIKHHQLLLLKALHGAVDGFVGRLDPDGLEQKFSRGRSGMLLNAANKLKYWDLYKDLYQLVANHSPGELPMQFLDDFAHAYEQEKARAAAADAAATTAQVAS